MLIRNNIISNPSMILKNKELHNSKSYSSTGANIVDTVQRIITTEMVEICGRASVSESNIGRLNQKIDIVNDNLLEVNNGYLSLARNLAETLKKNNEFLMAEIENKVNNIVNKD